MYSEHKHCFEKMQSTQLLRKTSISIKENECQIYSIN